MKGKVTLKEDHEESNQLYPGKRDIIQKQSGIFPLCWCCLASSFAQIPNQPKS